jgi:hypothetical protein
VTEDDEPTLRKDESPRKEKSLVVVENNAALDEADKYGYSDAKPDSANITEVDYGYGDAVPDSATVCGYGDAAPDSACPSDASPKMPRRSSMKGSAGPSHRRASIGATMSTVDAHLPGNRPLRRRRSITFQESVDVKQVEPVKSLAEEPDNLWFKDNEYDMMRTKIMTLINHIHSSGESSGIDANGCISVNGKAYCSRGLENLLNPELTQLKTSRALSCVLDEQFLQRQIGDFDEETLANIYKFCTLRSQREASQRASQDALVAADYLAVPKARMCRRSSM